VRPAALQPVDELATNNSETAKVARMAQLPTRVERRSTRERDA
jgi:hypothetical protein